MNWTHELLVSGNRMINTRVDLPLFALFLHGSDHLDRCSDRTSRVHSSRNRSAAKLDTATIVFVIKPSDLCVLHISLNLSTSRYSTQISEMASNPDIALFQCSWPECTSSYQRREHLNRHLKKHLKPKEHKCPYCTTVVGRRCVLSPCILSRSINA